MNTRLKNTDFWKQLGIYLFFAAVILTCAPLLKRLYWQFDGEIAAITGFCRFVFPFAVILTTAVFLIRRKVSLTLGGFWLILPVFAGYFLSTYLNGEPMSRPMQSFAQPALMLLFMALCCSTEYSKRLYLRVSADIAVFLAAVNLIYIYVFLRLWPDLAQMDGEWFETFIIPSHNQCGFVLLVGVLFCLLDAHFGGKREKLRLWVYCALYAVNVYALDSATSLVGFAIILLYVLLPFVRKVSAKVPFFVSLALNILFFVVIMFFFDQFVQLAPIRFIVKKVLHKSLTFSGRLYIWQSVMDEVRLKPVTGYGMLGPSFFFDGVNKFNNCFVHCHNQYLQAWHEAGILGVLAPLVMLICAGFRLHRCSDRDLAGIFNCVLFTMLFTLQTDQVTAWPWYIVLVAVQLVFLLCPKPDSQQKLN